MKRFFVMFTLLCSISSMGFAVTFQEDLEIYTYLYENSGTPTEKFDILQVIQTRKLTGIGEFYARAFKELVGQATSFPASEQTAANDLAQTLATLIGDEKHATSAPDLWRAYNIFLSAPLVRAECLISLGRVEAKEFLPQVVQVMKDLNIPLKGSEDADAKSHIARGAILALEKYKDISGYLPVFDIFISGRYPKRILDMAKATLPVILEDPSELLTTQVLRVGSGYGNSVKLEALKIIDDSTNASKESKAAAAAVALVGGWGSQPNSPRERLELATLRRTSIEMIGRYGISDSDSAVYPALERSYKEGGDDEKAVTIRVLGAVATEKSGQMLSSYLVNLVDRLRDKTNTDTDETLIRLIIPAIGATGQESGRAALTSAINGPTTPYIKGIAQDALGKLPKR